MQRLINQRYKANAAAVCVARKHWHDLDLSTSYPGAVALLKRHQRKFREELSAEVSGEEWAEWFNKWRRSFPQSPWVWVLRLNKTTLNPAPNLSDGFGSIEDKAVAGN